MSNDSENTMAGVPVQPFSLEKSETRLTRASTRRTLERFETRPTQDAADIMDLPYDMLNEDADMAEYTEETAEGLKPKRTISRVSGKFEDHELVTFKINDPENPKNWSKVYSMCILSLSIF